MCTEIVIVYFETLSRHKSLGQDNGCCGRDMNLGLLEHKEVLRARLQCPSIFRWYWKCNTVF
jgi:hypothetical protein